MFQKVSKWIKKLLNDQILVKTNNNLFNRKLINKWMNMWLNKRQMNKRLDDKL